MRLDSGDPCDGDAQCKLQEVRRHRWDSENRRPEARNGVEPTVRSSVKPSHNDNLIDRTLTVWKPRLGRDLSRGDAREIAENVIGFFTILAEWSRVERLAAANNAQAAPEPGGARHES
jgi:hypothetical protein